MVQTISAMGPKKASPSPKTPHSKAQAPNGVHLKGKVAVSGPDHLGKKAFLVGHPKPKHRGSSSLGELLGLVVMAIPVTDKPLPKGSSPQAPKTAVRQKPVVDPLALGLEKTQADAKVVHREKLVKRPAPKVFGATPTATRKPNISQSAAISVVHKSSLKSKRGVKPMLNQVGQDPVLPSPVGSAPPILKGPTIHAPQATTPGVLSADVVQAAAKPHSGWTARPVGLHQNAAVTTSVWQIQPPPIEGHHPWMMAVSSHNDQVQAQISIHPGDAHWALATGIGVSQAGPGTIPVTIGISSGVQDGVAGWTMAGGQWNFNGQSGGGASSQDYGSGQWQPAHHSQTLASPVRAASVEGVDLRI